MSNLDLVLSIKNGNNVQACMTKLYQDNMMFINYMFHKLNVSFSDYDDFLQLAYLALVDTIKYSKFDRYAFTTYYSRYIHHHYFEYFLQMGFPLRISKECYKDDKETIQNISSIEFHQNLIEAYDVFDEKDSLYCKDLVWGTIRKNTDELNYYILVKRYVNELSYAKIATSLGMTKEAVRQREIRCLQKLRKNEFLHEIARDFFKI